MCQTPIGGFAKTETPPTLTMATLLLLGSLTSQAAETDKTGITELPPVVVQGQQGQRDTAKRGEVTTLAGPKLILERGRTLGETVENLPGVSSAGFEPNVGRPVIRGQEGERAPLMANGSTLLDASALSQDHAVPLDPLSLNRIELIRGTATLRYSSNGVGGIINTVDNRIPRGAAVGINGIGELRYGGASDERAVTASLDGGSKKIAWHTDIFSRHAGDFQTPRYLQPNGILSRHVRNSDNRSDGGAGGGSLLWDEGYLGFAVDTYRSHYGTVVEDDVSIQMRRNTWRLAGEQHWQRGFIQNLRGQLAITDYQHREVAAGITGTLFRHKGVEGRVEVEHAAIPALNEMSGMWGLQFGNTRFSALGEEAFVPATHHTQTALFALENWQRPWGLLNLGLRLERNKVSSAGDHDTLEEPRFGSATTRTFHTRAIALGAEKAWQPLWKWRGSISHTERAPSFYELYANGIHIATAAYEVGNNQLRPERGTQIETGLEYKKSPFLIKGNVYANQFNNYIVLNRLADQDREIDGERVPTYQFSAIKARLIGLEALGNVAVDWGKQPILFEARLDGVRGFNRSGHQSLPRIPAWKLTVAATTDWLKWNWRAEVVNTFAQNQFSADDMRTPSATFLNLEAMHTFQYRSLAGMVFIKAHNVTNRLGYNAADFITIRRWSPQSGRALSAGLRVNL